MVEFQSSVKEKRSIFDLDELEDENASDENSYKCYNCSAISPSLANLYEHMETCDETKDQQIIYQCSICSLICSSLEELGNHMDMHPSETPVNQDVCMADIEEAVINADFVIADDFGPIEDTSMNSQNSQQEAVNEDIILEEIEDNDHLVIDEVVEVQDPTIDTTEVTVSFDNAAENEISEFESQKIDISPKDIVGTKDAISMDIKETADTSKQNLERTFLNLKTSNYVEENSNNLEKDENPSESRQAESNDLFSCSQCVII